MNEHPNWPIDKRNPPLWLLRTIVIVGLPFVLPFVFCNRLIHGMGDAVWYAWNEVMQNIAAARKQWSGHWPFRD